MSNDEKLKGLLTQEQFTAVFGIEPGGIQRYIKFGLPFELHSGKKYFNLIQVGQWLMRHKDAGYLSLEQTAMMFGVEVRTVTKWKNELGMPQSATGFYKRDDIIQWREKYLNKKIKELQSGGSDGVSANTKLKTAQAKRQELRLMKESGQLVEIDKVIPVFQRLFGLINQRKKVFAKRTNQQLEGIDNPGDREIILTKNNDEQFADIYETGLRELTGLSQFSGEDKGSVETRKARGSHDGKRTRRKVSISKSGKLKRSR